MKLKQRFARHTEFFEKVSKAQHTEQFYDVRWLQEIVKRALRMSRDANHLISVLEDRDVETIREAIREELSALQE